VGWSPENKGIFGTLAGTTTGGTGLYVKWVGGCCSERDIRGETLGLAPESEDLGKKLYFLDNNSNISSSDKDVGGGYPLSAIMRPEKASKDQVNQQKREKNETKYTMYDKSICMI